MNSIQTQKIQHHKVSVWTFTASESLRQNYQDSVAIENAPRNDIQCHLTSWKTSYQMLLNQYQFSFHWHFEVVDLSDCACHWSILNYYQTTKNRWTNGHTYILCCTVSLSHMWHHQINDMNVWGLRLHILASPQWLTCSDKKMLPEKQGVISSKDICPTQHFMDENISM